MGVVRHVSIRTCTLFGMVPERIPRTILFSTHGTAVGKTLRNILRIWFAPRGRQMSRCFEMSFIVCTSAAYIVTNLANKCYGLFIYAISVESTRPIKMFTCGDMSVIISFMTAYKGAFFTIEHEAFLCAFGVKIGSKVHAENKTWYVTIFILMLTN